MRGCAPTRATMLALKREDTTVCFTSWFSTSSGLPPAEWVGPVGGPAAQRGGDVAPADEHLFSLPTNQHTSTAGTPSSS